MFKKHLASSTAFALIFCAGLYAGAAWTEGEDGVRTAEAGAADTDPATETEEARPESGQRRGTPFGPMLVQGLKETPGCMKVESARTLSGKFVIFGWFEDKEAVKRWYYSDTHQMMLNHFFPDRLRDREPLTWVPDDTKPIMAIASITMPPPGEETFPQIAVELYTPLHGGFGGGGLFGPDSIKDEFMHYDQYYKDRKLGPYSSRKASPASDPPAETEPGKGQSRRR